MSDSTDKKITKEEIEKEIDEGIAEGDLEVVGFKDKERVVALTEKGRKKIDREMSPKLN